MANTITCPMCQEDVPFQQVKAHVAEHQAALGVGVPKKGARPPSAPQRPPEMPPVGNFPCCMFCGILFSTWGNVGTHMRGGHCHVQQAMEAAAEAAATKEGVTDEPA